MVALKICALQQKFLRARKLVKVSRPSLCLVLGVSVETVKTRLFEARKILRWPVLRYIHHGPDKGGKTEARRVDWVELTKRWVAPATREEESVVRRMCAWSLGPRPTAAAA